MKRRIALSIALALGVVMLALISSDSTVKAQPGRVFVADTGVITFPESHADDLRITVANGLDTARVRFRRIEYTQGSCDAGVCKHVISSQTESNPITLLPGEGASYDLGGTLAREVRVVVTTNRPNMQMNVMIINTTTGEVVATPLMHDGNSITLF